MVAAGVKMIYNRELVAPRIRLKVRKLLFLFLSVFEYVIVSIQFRLLRVCFFERT
jgi:hypothetical protein